MVFLCDYFAVARSRGGEELCNRVVIELPLEKSYYSLL